MSRLKIVKSNQVEILLELLVAELTSHPLVSPLTPEVIVTPSPAMARWVQLGLARQAGVAMNVEYPLPASYVWSLCANLLQDLPQTDPLTLDVMVWKIFKALPGLLPAPAFEALRRYLMSDPHGLKRWQLANRIADAFDRYQLYRPAQIRLWGDKTPAELADDWQGLLWRHLVTGLEASHRVAVIDRLLVVMAQAPAMALLPERVSLFAVSTLPPLLVEVIHGLGCHTAVDLYLHAPTDQFWADLITEKAMARKRLETPDEADLWEVGNCLLASWGRQGKAFQDLLLTHLTQDVDIEAFVPAAPSDAGCSLLQRIQQDIFELRPLADPKEREPMTPDGSLQVHVCHSALRECQVLHDRLLAAFNDDPALRPEDVLVIVPDISGYAPYLEAVFAQDDDRTRPFIPWNLSDTAIRDENPLVLTFLKLLELPESRFCHSEVASYLDVPELAGHFGLDSEAVADIKAGLVDTQVRWGRDGAHKQRLNLPAVSENTWAQAEQRLFGGYAMGDAGWFDGIAPLAGIDGARAEALGRFWRLLDTLTETARRLNAPRTAVEWQLELTGLLGAFFGERDDEGGQLQRIRDAIALLAEQASELDDALTPVLMRSWLGQQLETESPHRRYFSGGVTMCGMRPMRSLPFRMICVLGLDDLAFPRRDRLAEFDLMRRNWQPGDPRKSDEDRYLLLETLLCARKTLYLSYVGRDNRSNQERQPSVLLRELLDYVDQQYRLADSANPLSERLIRVHPLQAFSPRNFSGEEGSFDAYWHEVAQAMAKAGAGEPDTVDPVGWASSICPPGSGGQTRSRLPTLPVGSLEQSGAPGTHRSLPQGEGLDSNASWPTARLPEAPARMKEVTLVQLERFLRHPIKYFVTSRLQVYLGEEAVNEDTEPFGLEGLTRYGLHQRLVMDQLTRQPCSAARLRSEGLLPHAGFAELALDESAAAIGPLVERLRGFQGLEPYQVPVVLDFSADFSQGPCRLQGQVTGIYPEQGLLRWKPASLKGADILELWLSHLVWCAVCDGGPKRSALYTRDQCFEIAENLDPAAARDSLKRYLEWYWEGIHRPLPVLPKATFEYARGGNDPWKAAYAAWNGNGFSQIAGDKDDGYIQFILRGIDTDPLGDAAFAQLAAVFYEHPLAVGALS